MILPPLVRQYLHTRSVRERGSGCWIWTRAINSGGRPVRKWAGAMVPVARWALSAALGRPLRDGMVAGHRCDRGQCVNPDHLEEISESQNLTDAWARGRRTAPKTFTSRKGAVC